MRIPETPPAFGDLIAKYANRLPSLYNAQAARVPCNRYLHWSEMKRRSPPPGCNHHEWWIATKITRQAIRRELPFADQAGNPFWFAESGALYQRLFQIEREASGSIKMLADMPYAESRTRYLISSMFEEAIRSSQLEGAATTRLIAKEMLRTGRAPRNNHERMIYNNHRGMAFIREIANESLTRESLLELHRILTRKTLTVEGAAGRFRKSDESVSIVDERNGEILFTPPSAEQLEQRIDKLISFANQRDHQPFLHPVMRAALLHFMVGYEHPFVDGNGRTARALFYWLMVREGYWLMEYLSISSVIRRAPGQYIRAYLHTETDDCDFTYFLDYHLRVIQGAMRHLHAYLARKSRESMQTEALLENSQEALRLNHRQAALIGHLVKHPQARPTIASHQRSHGVTYQTARTDLLRLVDLELIKTLKRGRAFEFRLTPNFREQLRSVAGESTKPIC